MALTVTALQRVVNRFAGQQTPPMSGPVPCLGEDGLYGPKTFQGVQRVLELLQRNVVYARLPLTRGLSGPWGTTYPWEPYVSKLSAVTAGKFAEYLIANWNNKAGTASNLPVGEFLLWVADVTKQARPATCAGTASPSTGGGGGGGALPPPTDTPPPPPASTAAEPLDVFGVKVSRPVAYAAGGVLALLVGAIVLKRKRA